MNTHLPCHKMFKRLMAILVILSPLGGCNESGPEPLHSNGRITGQVQSRDKILLDGAKIVAHGPYGNPSTLTGPDGVYELSGLGNGTYEIEFFKEGFGTIYRQGIQLWGNDTITMDVRMYEMAEYQMPTLSSIVYYSSFPFMNENSIGIITDIPDDNNEIMQIRVFVNDSEDVSYKNYIHSTQAHAVKRDHKTQVLVAEVNPQIVNSGGQHLFNNGITLYLIAYVCSIKESVGEFNEYYGVPIFTTVDEEQHSEVRAFKAPLP